MTLVLNGTTGVSSVDGSASTPAIQGADTNTGVFFPAADTVAIATGGSERVRVDSSGNVGIGTTAPFGKIQAVLGTSQNWGGAWSTSTAVFGSAGSTGGAIALSYDDTRGGVLGSITPGVAWRPVSLYASQLLFCTDGANERARIDSSGVVMFNTTAQLIRGGETFRVNGGTGIASFYSNVNGPVIAIKNNYAVSTYQIAFNNNTQECGTITTGSNTVGYNSNSDYRLKEDVQPMTGALAKVALLKPVTYKWKADGSDGQGFIAHELQEVVPEAVTGVKDGVDDDGNPRYQGIDTSFLVATLTAAIQELKAELDALKAQVAGAQA